jgi:hypothetical protein
VFSFVPRCQGLCGSQKYTFTFVATVKLLCLAISSPRCCIDRLSWQVLSETGFSVCSPQSGNETYQKLALAVTTRRALDR